jgi:hypothetical protein
MMELSGTRSEIRGHLAFTRAVLMRCLAGIGDDYSSALIVITIICIVFAIFSRSESSILASSIAAFFGVLSFHSRGRSSGFREIGKFARNRLIEEGFVLNRQMELERWEGGTPIPENSDIRKKLKL